jgi:hypothetical protein
MGFVGTKVVPADILEWVPGKAWPNNPVPSGGTCQGDPLEVIAAAIRILKP